MHGEYKTPGGKLVVADLSVRDGKIFEVIISGDFFLEPPEALTQITNAIENLPAGLSEDQIAARIRRAIDPGVEMIGFSPEAIARAVRRAIG